MYVLCLKFVTGHVARKWTFEHVELVKTQISLYLQSAQSSLFAHGICNSWASYTGFSYRLHAQTNLNFF